MSRTQLIIVNILLFVKTITYMKNKAGFIDNFFRHLDVGAVTEFLTKLINLETQPEGAGTLEVIFLTAPLDLKLLKPVMIAIDINCYWYPLLIILSIPQWLSEQEFIRKIIRKFDVKFVHVSRILC